MGYNLVKDTRAPYKIYRRKTTKTKGGKPVYRYYYQLWDSETRTYSGAKSTGQTNRAAAESWLSIELAKQKKSALTVEQFATGLFDEESEYLIWREQRGRAMSWNHCRHCETYLKTYILPYVDDTLLADLRAREIERPKYSRILSQSLRVPIRFLGDPISICSPPARPVKFGFCTATCASVKQEG